MSARRGFWARYDAWWERNGHWAWLVTAALNIWGTGMQNDGWRWLFLAYGTIAAFNSGWCWREWARRRDMKRRNAFIVEGATRADVEAFIEELNWFTEQRKALHAQRAAADELTRMRTEDGA